MRQGVRGKSKKKKTAPGKAEREAKKNKQDVDGGSGVGVRELFLGRENRRMGNVGTERGEREKAEKELLGIATVECYFNQRSDQK